MEKRSFQTPFRPYNPVVFDRKRKDRLPTVWGKTKLPFEIWQENEFAFLNKTIKFDVKQLCENQVSQESEQR